MELVSSLFFICAARWVLKLVDWCCSSNHCYTPVSSPYYLLPYTAPGMTMVLRCWDSSSDPDTTHLASAQIEIYSRSRVPTCHSHCTPVNPYPFGDPQAGSAFPRHSMWQHAPESPCGSTLHCSRDRSQSSKRNSMFSPENGSMGGAFPLLGATPGILAARVGTSTEVNADVLEWLQWGVPVLDS